MSDFSTAPDAATHFGDVNPKHHEALTAIANAMRGVEPDHRNEAFRSLVSYPVELGYSGGPQVRRIWTNFGVLSL
jgi:hypothetical protein